MPPVTDARVSLPDRYRVVRHIADGGMASVWAADDELLGRLVSVKVLSPILARDAGAQRRFLREARAGARLSDCRYVVTIYDLGEHAGRAFLVMKHFAGGSVAGRLRAAAPIPRALALRWLGQAAEALDLAHSHDLVHRDVKPANLLLDERDQLAVGDFGLAKVATETSVTQPGQVLGTAGYLSPEQARGRPATPASDRYALAVVAFELLTGERPFGGENLAAQARAHVEDEVPRASAIAPLPVAVDDVLRRGLAKEPGGRPPSARALVDELDAALRDDDPEPATAVTAPVAARRAAAPRGPSPPRRRRPALLALGALALAAGAAAAIALGGGGKGEPAPTARRASSAPDTPTTRRTPSTSARSSPAPAPAATTPSTQDEPAPAAPTPAKPKKTKKPKQAGKARAPAATEPAALNDRGKHLIDAGRAGDAVAPLAAAVQAYRASGEARGLPYAFALFNLGNALRLAGRPAEAVPYLEERMRVSTNQRAIVERELAAARKQAGTG